MRTFVAIVLMCVGVLLFAMGMTGCALSLSLLAGSFVDGAISMIISIAMIVAATLTMIRADRISLRRRAPGLCAACGYDLRALRSTRCPECGHVVA